MRPMSNPLRVSIVVPVYQGEHTLPTLLAELAMYTTLTTSAKSHRFSVAEVVLVHDGAIDNSAEVMQALAKQYAFVRTVWLSKNFGQHPATLAGMASTTGDWIVTMDEDGQYNPADIGEMIDAAHERAADLVYGIPKNPPPHGWLRNFCSNGAKWVFTRVLGNRHFGSFSSFRLVRGEIGRSLAAYCGTSVFLDVALSWVTGSTATVKVVFRNLSDRPSGYSFRSLMRHFMRLVLTSGTKPLRFIAYLGVGSIVIAILISAIALWQKLTAQVPVQGWTSVIIVLCIFCGCILFSLGIIAEYVAVALNTMMGRPLYTVVSHPPVRKSHA